MDLERNVIVEVRERNAVLSADRLSDDDLVDVVELVPVFVSVNITYVRHLVNAITQLSSTSLNNTILVHSVTASMHCKHVFVLLKHNPFPFKNQ